MRAAMFLALCAACGGGQKRAAEPPPMVANTSAETTVSEPAAEPAPATTAPAPTAYKPAIKATMRGKLPQIQYCYEQALVANPTLTGTLDLHFTIDGRGNVIQAHGSGFPDPTVSDCVVNIVKGLQFPPPEGGGMVNVSPYPFTFKPAQP